MNKLRINMRLVEKVKNKLNSWVLSLKWVGGLKYQEKNKQEFLISVCSRTIYFVVISNFTKIKDDKKMRLLVLHYQAIYVIGNHIHWYPDYDNEKKMNQMQ